MTLEPVAPAVPAVGVQLLPALRWDLGYPQITECRQTIVGLEVTEIGPAMEPLTPAEAGARLRDVARQLVLAAASTAGLDAFELRYRVIPNGSAQATVQLYLLGKSYGDEPSGVAAAQAAVVAAALCLPPDFVVRPVDGGIEKVLSVPERYRIVELQRTEQVTFPQWNFVASDYYYHVDTVMGDGSGWLPFWRAISCTPEPLIVSILFKPTELHYEERDALGRTLTELGIYAHDRTDYNLLGQQDYYPADANALIAHKAWEERIQHIAQRPVLCRIAVAGSDQVGHAYAAHLAGALQQTRHDAAGFLQVATHDHLPAPEAALIRRSIASMEIWPSDCVGVWRTDGAPTVLRRMQYLYGVDEAASVAILPVPDQQGVPGFVRARNDRRRRTTRYAEDRPAGDAVVLGSYLHYGEAAHPAAISLAALNRHTLVVGVTGFGKTTTVMTLLAQLWRDHGVPWAVIEPTRPEYRGLAMAPGLEATQIFSFGREDISPLRLNPLQPPPGIRCAAHIGSLISLFKLAMALVPPLPELLAAALQRAYLLSGWDEATRLEDGRAAPTLRDLAAAFTEVFEEAGYVGEARNVVAAFAVRLRGLLAGVSGRTLDTVESTDLNAVLDRPVVFEMNGVEDPEEKALLGALLLQHVRAKATVRGSVGNRLCHVTVLEEAHRLLPATTEGSVETGQQTRARTVDEFVNAIAELRSSGEGFIICSQKPTRLAKAAVGNTDTRIVHHLTDADDREMMTRDMGAQDADREDAARLRVGECLVRWLPLEQPELVRVTPDRDADTARPCSDDDVAAYMHHPAQQARAMLPYALCTRAVCRGGCSPRIRSAGRALELRTRASRRAAEAAEPQGTREERLTRVAAAYAQQHNDDPAVTYCALVHAQVEAVDGGGLLGLHEHEIQARQALLKRSTEVAHGNARPN